MRKWEVGLGDIRKQGQACILKGHFLQILQMSNILILCMEVVA